MKDWSAKAKSLTADSSSSEVKEYFRANVNLIRRTLAGQGPHPTSSAQGGIRIVYNLPARYALDFLDIFSGKKGHGKYLNRYDVARLVGQPLNGRTIRERIDKALENVSKRRGDSLTGKNAYYGAMELNGTGIRYFGDVCLVLKPENDSSHSLTLLRNSYDLCVAPVVEKLEDLTSADQDRKAVEILDSWAGRWGTDGINIALVKIMKHAAPRVRRMTTAHVSEGVLEDEDYIEVVRNDTFRHSDVEEIRLTANDAALESQIADRVRVGNPPSAAQMLWRFRRRWVDHGARRAGLPIRTVTKTGRART